MDFKDSRLYELLRWIVAAVVGFGLLCVCMILLDATILKPLYMAEVFKPLYDLKEEDVAGQLAEKKEALIASSGYEQIDEIISIEKQLIAMEGKGNAIKSSFQKKQDMASYLLMLFGLLLMLLSMFVTNSTAQLLLAATGAVFPLWIGGDSVIRGLSFPLQTIILLLLASIAYISGYFLSREHDSRDRYLFLQLFGALSLAFALVMSVRTVEHYAFPSVGRYDVWYPRKHELLDPLQKEQIELLMNEHLSKEQKDLYVELANELDSRLKKWQAEEPLSWDQQEAEIREQNRLMKKFMLFSVFAVLYMLLGIFLNAPLLISFGFVLAGSLLLGIVSFHLIFFGSYPYTLLNVLGLFIYGLFAAAMLLFVGHRLYHQHR